MESNSNSLSQKSKETQEKAKSFFRQLIEIKSTTNEEGTIKTIKEGISMKGHTAWILVFSIFTASIGLNANSTAVVIGAMLISPLMGPILGVGLSIGINDIVTLRRSLTNLGVMVALSLLTSFLFFSIPLFQDATSELLARTRPDVRDVLIALSGGLALIVAISRPSPQTNTVAGVAIATALMPPLCTAGYGLASGNFSYFFGAMFLFTINCIFIALATFMIVKYLGFTMVKYINSARRKHISRIASVVATVIAIASMYSFYTFIIENRFNQRAQNFINELKENGIAILGDDTKNIDYSKRTITLPLLGNMVSDLEIRQWEQKIKYLGLENVTLKVQQKDDTNIKKQVQSLQDLYNQNQKLITSKDETIKQKDDKIRLLEVQLSKFYTNQIDFKAISEEAVINYPNITDLSYYKRIHNNYQAIDTINVFEIKWSDQINNKDQITQKEQLYKWLKLRLKLDTLNVVSNISL
ncbi:DUF389 domain-containing protein [Tenacibaculum maritimum]|uniref:DUF389 domain-containing protein n=2 Tax=Tenacibaculum maritimum TaxID=107401 RepID=UPI0012E5D7C7|nr:DUF389 domain-containing protein [Tenacibaculum maritimum]MCD9565564.1 DUF389 domain-containing protein [Tenacibaculum maritimum]MCD9579187.1 DUF389 domain-containing protein [Tenacibaculum maritimum]MCD9596089.1 DUF389 domain-containing protein [Tenacibaculum maritimum]MCD9613338.1 DUF389 domain-containing protein [Tenacibaculum maritimum]CAA0223921.1 conserved membrane hypothetical protein [Tenacibaculum maritimum]